MQITLTDWINAIGWTLLHSLWQALIIFLVIAAVSRFLPTLRSGIRYAIACGGLVLTVILSVTTFLNVTAGSAAVNQVSLRHTMYQTVALGSPVQDQTLLMSVIDTVERNMSWVVLVWAIGFLIFLVRAVAGYFRAYRIQSDAYPLGGEWQAYVQRTAMALGIPGLVSVAESARISAPVVMGYFKPIILIPVGMISGLTTQQLETIFLHELAHIHRHDYLVNLFQTVIETIFFFNPFVRMLSNEIRREREYCCDDLVVRLNQNASAYAHALVTIAETRLDSPAFALSLTGNKNELFIRIKRIMERSAKTYAGKTQWLVPFVLMIAGLVSIFLINTKGMTGGDDVHHTRVEDVPHYYTYTAYYSSQSIITIDELWQLHEEVTSTIPPLSGTDWEGFHESFFKTNEDLRKVIEQLDNTFQLRNWSAPFDQPLLDRPNRLRDGNIHKNFREEFEKFRGSGGERMEVLLIGSAQRRGLAYRSMTSYHPGE